MLTQAELEQRAGSRRPRRRGPQPSLRQRYHEYLLQRIEDFKNRISREELFQLGNEAMAELQDDPDGQYFLDEVLREDLLDKLITKRLRLPGFGPWRRKFPKLRQAQQEPTHWGLERRGAVAAALERIEPGDHALVIGGGAEAIAYLLAAHEVRLTCLIEDDPTCSQIEARMAAESLTGGFQALVVMLGSWFPEIERPVHLVAIDAGLLADLPSPRRLGLMAWLQDLTVPGGLHAVLGRVGSVAAETWLSLYPDWDRVALRPDPGRRGSGAGLKRGAAPGVLLSRPLSPAGAPQHQASTA